MEHLLLVSATTWLYNISEVDMKMAALNRHREMFNSWVECINSNECSRQLKTSTLLKHHLTSPNVWKLQVSEIDEFMEMLSKNVYEILNQDLFMSKPIAHLLTPEQKYIKRIHDYTPESLRSGTILQNNYVVCKNVFHWSFSTYYT